MRDVPGRLRKDREELWAVKVFPIAYGSGDEVDTDVLQEQLFQFSEATLE